MDYITKIISLRKKLAVSQEDLAHELGVSFATVSRWETGKSKPSKLAEKAIDLYCEKLKLFDNEMEVITHESR